MKNKPLHSDRKNALFDLLIKEDISFKRPQRTYGRHRNRRMSFLPEAFPDFDALIKERNSSEENITPPSRVRAVKSRRKGPATRRLSLSDDEDFVTPKKKIPKKAAANKASRKEKNKKSNKKKDSSHDSFNWTEIENFTLIVEKPKPKRKSTWFPLPPHNSQLLTSTPCDQHSSFLLADHNFFPSTHKLSSIRNSQEKCLRSWTNHSSLLPNSSEKKNLESKLSSLKSPRVMLTPLKLSSRLFKSPIVKITPLKGHSSLYSSKLSVSKSPRVPLTPLKTHSNKLTSYKSPNVTPLKGSTWKSGSFLSPGVFLRSGSQDLFPSPVQPAETSMVLDIADPEEHLLALCQQDDIDNFVSFLPKQEMTKIGEGVYGEVFLAQDSEVLKVIPVNGCTVVNGETQKTFQEVLSEALISRELSKLSSSQRKNRTSTFIQLHSLHLLRGKYPRTLLRVWDAYSKDKSSHNDRPSIFPRNQTFLVFGFQHGGTALDSTKLENGLQAGSLWTQVACALAVAERSLQFEHRDLHTGNVLVAEEDITIHYCLDGVDISVPSCGVRASIIDFTMARLTRAGFTFFLDVSSDEALFTGKGDYQFDIYRKMRKHNGNSWEHFAPYTNVLWLHYLAYQLLYKIDFRHKKASHFTQLKSWYRKVLKFQSAEEFVLEHYVH